MKTKIIEKRKAIILNEDYKVLVFHIGDLGSRLVYPSIKEEYNDTLPFLGSDYLNHYEPLITTREQKISYKVVNGHADKTTNAIKKYYYAMMHVLTEEEKEALIISGHNNGLIPDFLTTEEIRIFFENKYYAKSHLTGFTDLKLEPINEIEKKLKRNMNIRRDDTHARY